MLSMQAVGFVTAESSALLRDAMDASHDVVAVSALAEGADSLFAEAALSLQVPLEVVRPFARYDGDFTTPQSRRRYRDLKAAARSETELAFVSRSVRAYEAAMRWVVENCDILVAVCDGRPSLARGGTADAVGYAARVGRPIVRFDTVGRVVVGRAQPA
jgi:hypothetical protein